MNSSAQAITILGQPAHDYLRVCLDAGQSIIAQQAPFALETGYVWAFLPVDFLNAQMANPEWSLSSAQTTYVGRGDSDVLLGQFMMQYLRGGQRYAVFQDWKATPGDSRLLEQQGRYFTSGSEVYHVLHSSDSDLTVEGIIKVMRRGYMANARQNAGVLTTVTDLPRISPGQQITSDIIRTLAMGVDHIIVEAFDGEREIIWSKEYP